MAETSRKAELCSRIAREGHPETRNAQVMVMVKEQRLIMKSTSKIYL